MKSKLEIYALSVCFSAIVCIVISAGIGSYSALKIVNPELTMNAYEYDRHQSNAQFRRWYRDNSCCNSEADKQENKVIPEEDLTKARQESFASSLHSESRGGVQSFIKSIIFLVFGVLALISHWRIAKNARA